MKPVLLALFLLLEMMSFAQTPDSLKSLPTTFFTKGQEWEYANFQPKTGLFGKRKGYYEITRFVYKVINVTDSGRVSMSTIAKTGTAANENYSWHRTFIARTDYAVLSLPVDYYMMDTFYLCDAYGKSPRPYVYSELHVKGDSLQYPLKIETTTLLKRSNYQMENKVYDPQRAQGMTAVGFKGQTNVNRFKAKATEATRRIVGMERITTQAGTFDCFHIHIEVELDAFPNHTSIEEYYNPAVGIVRTEDIHGPYMELVRVKKKK